MKINYLIILSIVVFIIIPVMPVKSSTIVTASLNVTVDTFIHSGEDWQDTNWESLLGLLIQNNSFTWVAIRFDVSSLENMILHNATLKFYISPLEQMYGGPNISAYRITNNWVASTITWNNRPSHDPTAYGAVLVTATSTWYSLDITEVISMWINGTSNFGLYLKTPTGHAGMESLERSGSNNIKMTVVYTDPTIYEFSLVESLPLLVISTAAIVFNRMNRHKKQL